MTTTEEFLSKTETLLCTQDNACTADPIFLVEEKRRRVGLDADYADDVSTIWVNYGSEDEVTLGSDPERFAKFQAGDFGDDDPNEWTSFGYVDEWVFVQPFLTLEAAETYRKRQAHNHRETRVDVDSGYRNPEWQQLRAMLMEGHALNALRLASAQAEQLRAANSLISKYREGAGTAPLAADAYQRGAETMRETILAAANAAWVRPGETTASAVYGANAYNALKELVESLPSRPPTMQRATYEGPPGKFLVNGVPVDLKDGDTIEGLFPTAVPLADEGPATTKPCPAMMCRDGKTGDGWDCTWCKGTGRVPITAVFPTATYHGPARMLINGIPFDLKDGDTFELNSPRTCAAVLALADRAHVLADWIDDQTKPGAYARSLEVSLRMLAGGQVPVDIDDPAGARCDPEIYEKGETLFVFHAPKNLAEPWVRRVAMESGERVDWHYVAGRAVVRYLGDKSKVRAAIEKFLPDLRSAVKIHNYCAYGISNLGGEAGNGDTGYFLEEDP